MRSKCKREREMRSKCKRERRRGDADERVQR
jgi:hypothetical protein